MSVPKRKVYRYALRVIDNKNGNVLSPEMVKECFEHILNKPKIERRIEDQTTNRIHYLDEFKNRPNYGLAYFVSAKHHHRPPLVNTADLSQRENPKEPEEGEMEKTHFAIGFGSEESFLLLEKKQGGVSIGKLITYLNNILKYLKGKGQHIEYDLFVSGSFLTKLKEMPKVLCAQIYTGTELLTDTFLKHAAMEKEIRDNIELVIKAKRGHSIKTDLLEWFYKKFAQEGKTSRINRMRIIGKSEDNDTLLLDTEYLTESEYIEVDLDDNGQVITTSIFPKLRTLIRGMLQE